MEENKLTPEEKLKALKEKQLPDNVKKSIEQKEKHTTKPLKK